MFVTRVSVFVLILSLECSFLCRGSQIEDWYELEEADSVVLQDSWPENDPSEGPAGADVQYPEQPAGVIVSPIPLMGSRHELSLNVSWDPPTGPKVDSYSLEVHSETNTKDCRMVNFCYEFNIPGDSVWGVIPVKPSPVAGECVVKPGCAYRVQLIASPSNGRTSANTTIELDECVSGACSCAHAPRLPAPRVAAAAVVVRGTPYVNVTWSLPQPDEPLRLPPRLMKDHYIISVGKEVFLKTDPVPKWYLPLITSRFDAFGFVVVPDELQWRLLPINEWSAQRDRERSAERSGDGGTTRSTLTDMKLVARVSLVDARGCTGRPGNATAHDPSISDTAPGYHFQAVWAVLGGACVLLTVLVLAFGARLVKRVLKEFRPDAAAAALRPLRPTPNWFPQDTICPLGWNFRTLPIFGRKFKPVKKKKSTYM